jgi:hypothetical protein
MRSFGTVLSTSVQADRHGPSITTLAGIPYLLEQVEKRADLPARTAEDANLGLRGDGEGIECHCKPYEIGETPTHPEHLSIK